MDIKCLMCLIFLIGIVKAPPPRRQGCLKARRSINFKIRKDNIVDLTYVYDEDSMYWPGNPSGFQLSTVVRDYITEPIKMFIYYNMMSQPEHVGTHMDAPIHFSEKGETTDQVSLLKLIANGVLLNMKEVDGFNSDSFITVDHFLDWERKNHAKIRSGSIVLVYTGHGDSYGNRAEYAGTNITGEEGIPYFRFPGLHPDAAEWLVTKRCIGGYGSDTLSIDHGQSTTYGSHNILCGNNIPLYENVANLDKLAAAGRKFNVIALPQKIAGGSGAPTRMVAVLN